MDFLVIDDDKTFRDATCFLIEEAGHYAEGVESGQLGLNWLKEDKWDAVLLDVNLGRENGLDVLVEIQKQFPQIPVVMFTAQGSVKIAVEAMRRGAVDFLEKPFQREQFMTVLARLQRLRQMSQRIERLEQEVIETKAQNLEPIFDFTTPAMQEVMDILMRAAKTPASILILGESGAGKSVAARAVHEKSHLADKPFVTVSCPSLSKELLESELFGHVRGSFTGAIKDHWGKVKAAEGGTLFLDEIGDLPMEIQPKLLRLLQEREYERLGENVTRHGKFARHRRDKSRFEKTRGRRFVPRRFIFPAQCHRRGNAAVAFARRRLDPLRRALRKVFRGTMRAQTRRTFTRSRRVRPRLFMAGQSSRTAKCHRARRHSGQRRKTFPGRFSRRTARPKYSGKFRRRKSAASRLVDFAGKT